MTGSNLEIKRGEIWLIDLPQIEGSIQYGKRPCILLSTDVNNKFSPILNVIPTTTRLRKVYPMHVLVPKSCGLKENSFALPEQMMPVMKERALYKLGECDEATMRRVEEGVRIQQGMASTIDYSYLTEKLTLLQDLNEQIQHGFNVSFNLKMKSCFEKDLSRYCMEHNLNYKKLVDGIFTSKQLDYRELKTLIG